MSTQAACMRECSSKKAPAKKPAAKKRPAKKAAGTVAKRHQHLIKQQDADKGLTKPAIRRLLRRAGVKKVSGLIYDEIRHICGNMIDAVIYKAAVFCENQKKMTLSIEHLKLAVEALGLNLAVEKNKEGHATLSGAKLENVEKHNKSYLRTQQKNLSKLDLMFARASFIRFARYHVQDYNKDFRCTKSFLEALQFFIEARIVSLCENAQRAVAHAKRVTILPKDLRLASDSIGGNSCPEVRFFVAK